jgi:hypothetical protein
MAASRAGSDTTNRITQEVDVPKLVVFRGDAVESETRLAGNTVRIGRHSSNDVVLDDSLNGVSRFHAEVRLEGGKYVIADLNSRNGVYINQRRIRGKAQLDLGVPVTIGSFELALEDDSASGEFPLPVVNQNTVVNAPAVDHSDASSRSRTRPGSARSSDAPARREFLWWSVALAAVLLISAVTVVVVRRVTRPIQTVAELPPAPPPERPVTTLPEPETNPAKSVIDPRMEEARERMAAGDYNGALDSLNPVIEDDPDNTEARDLKRQAEVAIAAAAAKNKKTPPPGKPPDTPAEVEIAGIPRRPGELPDDYTARVKRVQIAVSEAKNSLDRQDYAGAINRLRAIARDQPGYPGIEQLLAEAIAEQKKALDEAMNGGQANEQADKLHDARMWYQRAMRVDPSATSARERETLLRSRMATEAANIFERASAAKKIGDEQQAIRLYRQIVDMMLPGDDIREQAQKQLEALKP